MSGDAIDVIARIYHTENGTAHAEGETYSVTDRELADTLRGIGFVTLEERDRERPDHGRHEPEPERPGQERREG